MSQDRIIAAAWWIWFAILVAIALRALFLTYVI
jgi:hypothetical protein